MIQFTYKLNRDLEATFQCKSLSETIEYITELDKIFRADTKCGFCESDILRFRARETSQGHKYYELVCCNPECGAHLQVHKHQNEAEGMYVKQFAGGKALPNRGWEKRWERSSGRAAQADSDRDTGPEPRDEEVPQSGRRAG